MGTLTYLQPHELPDLGDLKRSFVHDFNLMGFLVFRSKVNSQKEFSFTFTVDSSPEGKDGIVLNLGGCEDIIQIAAKTAPCQPREGN